jgi:RNA polymerase sigma factor (sigma-70 family)
LDVMISPVEVRQLDEAALVERARGGDTGAFGELVERHSDIAQRTAYLITGSAAEAQDAAQDAFVAAWRAIPRFRAGDPLRPWLLRIVSNTARNRRRASGRRQGAELRLADRSRSGGEAAASPEGSAEAAEGRARLLAALGALADRDREVVVLRHVVGLSVGETAAVLGCREGTVKSRLARALRRLRTLLGEEGAR